MTGCDLVNSALLFQESESRCDDAKSAILVGPFHSFEPIEIKICGCRMDKPSAGIDSIVHCIAIEVIAQWD